MLHAFKFKLYNQENAEPFSAPVLPPFPSTFSLPAFIQFPSLYRLTKDGKQHLVFGTFHDIGLEKVPKEYIQYLQSCEMLLTEDIAYLSTEKLKKHLVGTNEANLISWLKSNNQEVTKSFLNTINFILRHLGIESLEEIEIDHINSKLLNFLYESVSDKKMDCQLIGMFKNLKKPVIELHDIHEILKAIQDNPEEEVKYQDNYSAFFACDRILKDYLGKVKLLEIDSSLAKCLEECFTKDIMDNHSLEASEQAEKEFLEDYEKMAKENLTWFTRFTTLHEQGKNNMLLACGNSHLFNLTKLSPTDNPGLLSRLTEYGFTLEKFYPGVGFKPFSLETPKSKISVSVKA